MTNLDSSDTGCSFSSSFLFFALVNVRNLKSDQASTASLKEKGKGWVTFAAIWRTHILEVDDSIIISET